MKGKDEIITGEERSGIEKDHGFIKDGCGVFGYGGFLEEKGI